MDEVWKPIPDFEGKYEVSDHGQVRSLSRTVLRKNGAPQTINGRTLTPGTRRDRKSVNLYRGDGSFESRYIHHLVLEAFAGTRPAGMEGCHNNGDANDNRAVNLRWDTRSANERDKLRHGTHNHASKTHCKRGHALQAPNLVPYRAKKGHRICLACHRAGSQVNYRPELKADIQKVSDSYYSQIIKEK